MTVTREDILAVVKKKAAEIIPNLDPNSIDEARSLQEYGASSLDLVELVSVTMRELKVKIPRSELGKITNLSGLVDLFFVASQQKAAH